MTIAGFGEVGSEKGETEARQISKPIEQGSDVLLRALPLGDDEEWMRLKYVGNERRM